MIEKPSKKKGKGCILSPIKIGTGGRQMRPRIRPRGLGGGFPSRRTCQSRYRTYPNIGKLFTAKSFGIDVT